MLGYSIFLIVKYIQLRYYSMFYCLMDNNKLKNFNKRWLITCIYENFSYLNDVKQLSHTTNDITKLVNSKNARLYLCIMNKKIVGYLIGETMTLNDGRNVFYVSYLYIADKYRKKGYASFLMSIVNEYVKKNNLDGIMLTCDTDNVSLYDFYMKRGFMPDLLLRTYDRYDVLYNVGS